MEGARPCSARAKNYGQIFFMYAHAMGAIIYIVKAPSLTEIYSIVKVQAAPLVIYGVP